MNCLRICELENRINELEIFYGRLVVSNDILGKKVKIYIKHVLMKLCTLKDDTIKWVSLAEG